MLLVARSRLLTKWLYPTSRSNVYCWTRCSLLASETALGASTACTFPVTTRACTSIASAAAGSLVAVGNLLHCLLVGGFAAVGIITLLVRLPSL